MGKLASRKLWVTLVAIGIVALVTFLGLELPPENSEALLGVVVAYLVGQGAVDVAAAVRAGTGLGLAAQSLKLEAEAAEAVIEG